ncbi:phage domain protein [Streptococcus pneumoniae GA44500]|nr:phage domain protein [Streptococcus pneumoniae GA44500]
MTKIEIENRVWLLANHEEKTNCWILGRCMLMFNYDRDIMQPPEEREELDPADWIFSAGQWIYVGDC